MIPTTEFRWAVFHKSELGWEHPSALTLDDYRAMVLQQKWSGQTSADPDYEWRDIPMWEVD